MVNSPDPLLLILDDPTDIINNNKSVPIYKNTTYSLFVIIISLILLVLIHFMLY